MVSLRIFARARAIANRKAEAANRLKQVGKKGGSNVKKDSVHNSTTDTLVSPDPVGRARVRHS